MDDQYEAILLIATSMIVLVLFAITVLIVMIIYRKRKVQHEKELLETQLAVQQQTMRDIGQEIHDNVAQQFSLAFLKIHHMLFSNDLSKEKLAEVGEVMDTGLHDLRNLSRTLTDTEFVESDLYDLVARECDKARKMSSCDIRLECSKNLPHLAVSSKRSVLRIIQEFVGNSLRHANCSCILVQMTCVESALLIKCSDDGAGFIYAEETEGSGIRNMRRRANLMGCDLNLKSLPGQGTSMDIMIPLNTGYK